LVADYLEEDAEIAAMPAAVDALDAAREEPGSAESREAAAAVQSLQTELDQARQALTRLQLDCQEQTQRAANVAEALHAAEAGRRSLEDEVSRLTAAASQWDIERQRLLHSAEAANQRLDEHAARRQELEAEREQLQRQEQALLARAVAAEQRIQAHQLEAERWRAAEARHENEAARLNRRLEEQQQQLSTLQQDLKSQQQRSEEAAAAHSQLQVEYNAALKGLTAHSLAAAERESRLQELQQAQTAWQNEQIQWQQQLAQLSTREASLVAELTGYKSKWNAACEQIAAAQAELNQSQAQWRTREQELSESLTAAATQAQSLTTELDHRRAEADMLKLKRSELEQQLHQLQTQLAEGEKLKAVWERERSQLVKMAEAAKGQFAQLQQRLAITDKSLQEARLREEQRAIVAEQSARREEALSKDLSRLQTSLAEAECKSVELEEALATHQRENAELRQNEARQQREQHELQKALVRAGADLETRSADLRLGRAEDAKRLAAFETRLKQAVAREQELAARAQRQQAVAAASEERRLELEKLLESLNQRLADSERLAAVQTRSLAELTTAQADVGTLDQLQSRTEELSNERAQLLAQQADLSQRLAASAEHESMLASEVERMQANEAAARARIQQLEQSLESLRRAARRKLKLVRHQRESHPSPQLTSVAVADSQPPRSGSAQEHDLPFDAEALDLSPAASNAAETVHRFERPGPDIPGEVDEVVSRLMAYHSRGQAGRTLRIALVALGVMAFVVAVAAMAWQFVFGAPN
jgi:chromosome segregation ATPase